MTGKPIFDKHYARLLRMNTYYELRSQTMWLTPGERDTWAHIRAELERLELRRWDENAAKARLRP